MSDTESFEAYADGAPVRPLPPNAGKGRPKGSPNKATALVKEMILGALEAAGGQEYLKRQSEENPKAFLTLVGRVLPLQLTGDGGGPVVIQATSQDEAL
jgi:hypothetical protein